MGCNCFIICCVIWRCHLQSQPPFPFLYVGREWAKERNVLGLLEFKSIIWAQFDVFRPIGPFREIHGPIFIKYEFYGPLGLIRLVMAQ